jgi:hypothetical protein
MFFNNNIKILGGDGSTQKTAIKILGARSDAEGVDAEYRYLDKNYPSWVFDQQTLILDEDRQYDIMAIILPDGSRKEVWFDITEFYKLE